MAAIERDILGVMHDTWPIIALTCVVLITLRLAYIFKNNIKGSLHKDLLMLVFIVYILCLFQIVTSQDVSGAHGINITLFKELTRYQFGSRLFYRNIVGNIALFLPFGFFTSYYLDLDKKRFVLLISIIVSFVIEFIQLRIGRAFDVDDVILNVCGGLLGYFMYRVFDRIFGNLKENVRASLILGLIFILIVGMTIVLL